MSIKLAFAPRSAVLEVDLSGRSLPANRNGLQIRQVSQYHDSSLEAVDE